MSKDFFENVPNLASALNLAVNRSGRSTCEIDYERYRGFFDDPMVTDEEKDQWIEMLFRIGHAFYDAGFAYEFDCQACGKNEETQDDPASCGQGVLSSPDVTLSKKFNLCAAE